MNCSRNRHCLITIILILFSLIPLWGNDFPRPFIMDASKIQEGEIKELDKNWFFYPEEFLTEVPETAGQAISLPSSWNNFYQKFGYGSFYIQIAWKNGEQPSDVVLAINEIRSAYRVIINGVAQLSSGSPGANQETEIPHFFGGLIHLHCEQENVYNIIIHVSNFNSRTGGILQSLKLGNLESILGYSSRQAAIIYFLTGSYLIIALYHFMFYFTRKKEKVFLYFAFFALLSGIRIILLDYQVYGYTSPLPFEIPYELVKKLEYLTFLPAFSCFFLFFNAFFENPGWKRAGPLVILISFVFIFETLVLPYRIYTSHTRFYQIVILLGAIYCVVLLVLDSLKKKKDSLFFLASLLTLIAVYIFDITTNYEVLSLPELIPVGFMGFILFQAFLLSRRFSFALNRVEDLSEDINRLLNERKKTMKQLEKRVSAKTIEYQKAVEDAEQASKAKGDFLARMSHEIRTPLNGIMGFAEIIQDSPSDTERIHYSHLIINESEKLLELINQLLDISKIEAGKMMLEKRNFTLQEIINSIRSIFTSQVKEKGLELNFNIPESELYLIGDSFRLRQVLINLLGNALKFTDKGSITLEIIQTQDSDLFTSLMFIINDTGIGISPEKQLTIFSDFEQADSSITRKFGGTGLGTSISKNIVEMMNGTIGLSSIPGEGTSIWFEISFNKGEALNGKSREEKSSRYIKKFSNKRVLVAEDYFANQIVIKKHLESAGFLVEIYENGKEAVDAFNKYKYDLVCLDIHMPVMDGYMAAREIRKSPGGNDIPILGLTADAYPDTMKKCQKAGMNEVITKPLRKEHFYSVLDNYFTL